MAEPGKLEHFMLHDVKYLDSEQNDNMKLEIDGVIYNGNVLGTLLQIENDTVFRKKCQAVSELRHPNIQKFKGVCFVPGLSPPILVMEHVDTSLDVFLESTPEISLRCKCSILHGVAQGLAYLHERSPPIILGELNTKNVFLDSDMTAKISASYLLDVVTGDDDGATARYTASSAENDVSSFGQMAICLLHPESHHTCHTDAFCDVKNDFGGNRLLMMLLQKCLIGDCRPSIQQIAGQLESTMSELINSDGKSPLVQLLVDSEDSEHLNPEMEAVCASSSEDCRESVTSTSSSSNSSTSCESVLVTVSVEPMEHHETEDEMISEHQAPTRGVYSSLITRRYELMQEFEKKTERYKELLLQEMQITGIPPRGLTADEIEKMKKKLGVSYKFSKLVMGDSLDSVDGNVDDLERQLEIQSFIIEASKDLLSQTNDRRLKKGRKKGIKQAEKKFLKLEEKLQKKKRASESSASMFYVDLPPQAGRRKSLDLTATGSPVGSYLSPESNLKKPLLHRSSTSLNEMESNHTHVSATQSLVYHAMFAFH